MGSCCMSMFIFVEWLCVFNSGGVVVMYLVECLVVDFVVLL